MTVDLKLLIDKLPTGWAETIRARLGDEYTAQYIRMVVKHNQRWNKLIAEEAVKLAEEHQQELRSIKERVAALTEQPQA